jgi:ubiquinone/menaquinone biosynthesis C-methylase UbiE
MSTSSLDTVRERFERDAASFDAIYRLERSPLSRWFNKTFRMAVFERYDLAFAHAGDVTDKAVLDVGCGSGVYSVDFARRGARRVVGVDFSGNMLDLARREAEQHGVTQTCQFIQANFLDLSFPERFDVAIAMGVFDYLAEPVPFLRKMTAETNGRVIASFPGHSPIRKPLRRLRYRLTGKGDVYYYREADVRRLATDAGLKRISIIPIRSSGSGFVLVGEC